MDPHFTFPSRPKAIPRPTAPHSPPAEPVNRESNALRASVLDVALQLGLGSNKTVANWMFSDSALEEQEEEEADEDLSGRAQLSPTSDEYAPYSTPATSIESHSEAFKSTPSPSASPTHNTATSPQVHFPPPPVITAPATTNKLRKQRRDAGYESDGGYVSDGGKKGRARTKSKPTKPDPAAVFPISEPMELVPVSKEDRKRKKKAAKGKDAGAETDTEEVGKSTKSKTSPKSKNKKKSSVDAAAGYETDDGYVSSSGKPKPKTRGRFFSLRKKDTAPEPAEVEPVPPMPEREVFELPIASRFATTLGPGSAVPSAAPSRSETPLLPPTRPFASASGSSSPSLSSSSVNSLLTPADQDSFATGFVSSDPGYSYPGAVDDWSGRKADKSPNSSLNVTSPSINQEQLSSRSASPIPPNAKPNLISYPLTRTASPSPPSGQKPAAGRPRVTPSPILLAPNPPRSGLNSRAPSPGPSPMGSPYVLLTPINTSGYPGGRPHSPAASGGSSDVVPSTDFIVPSRSTSPLPPSPNVLGYYDVPPPSPPPTGPLPRPPPSAMRDPAPGPGIARLRSLSRDRAGNPGTRDALSPTPDLPMRSVSPSTVPPSPWAGGGRGGATSPMSAGGATSPMSAGGAASPMSAGGSASPNGVQRGRAAPFPSQPILLTRAASFTGAGVGPGLAARAKVQRYRDLYAIQIPDSPERERAAYRQRAQMDDDEASVNIHVDEGSDDEGEYPEMAGVLGRFRDGGERQPRMADRALERNNSGALRAGTRKVRFSPSPSPTRDAGAYSDDDEVSRYPDEDRTAGRTTMYKFDNGSRGSEQGGFRETMYSDYSRASFLDLDKSEQARSRLVDRVGAMFDKNGRERSAIPPVPKLPPELQGGANRF